MDTTTRYRDRAVTMIKQGSSAAEVWEALTSDGMDSHAAEALVRDLMELRRQAEAAEGPNMYAPPVYHAPVDYSPEYVPDQGALWKGLLLGLCCGCWALIFSSRMGSETRKGAYIGFGINLFLNVVRIMATIH